MAGKIDIPRNLIGSVSGVGNANVFGLAMRPGSDFQVAYIDLVGPKTSVESVWAKLLLPREITWIMTPGNAPNIRLDCSPGLRRLQSDLAMLGQDNLVAMLDDEDEQHAWRYILLHNGIPNPAMLLHQVQQVTKVPVYYTWCKNGTLYDLAVKEKVIMPCRSYGGIELAGILKHEEKWEAVISAGKKADILQLPSDDAEDEGLPATITPRKKRATFRPAFTPDEKATLHKQATETARLIREDQLRLVNRARTRK